MGYNLLLVDDSSIIRKSLKKILVMCEASIGDVYEASNGQEALEEIDKHWIDLIFLDINMPVMNGVAFLKELRQHPDYSKTPVLIISTEGSKLRYQELEALGISGVLRKPVRPEELSETLERLLGAIENE